MGSDSIKNPISFEDLVAGQNMRLAFRGGPRESISWGSLHLDFITNGMPRGLINQIAGRAGRGKTLIAIMTLMQVLKRNQGDDPIGMPIVIDSERRWDETFAAKSFMLNGLRPSMPRHSNNQNGSYYRVAGTTIESNWNLIMRICENNMKIGSDPENPNYIGYVLWDSLGQSPNDASLMKNLKDTSQPGAYAVVNNNAARQAMLAIDDANIYTLVLNGVYDKIGVTFGSPDQRRGGSGIEFATSIGIQLNSPDSKPSNMSSKPGDVTLDEKTGAAYKRFKGRTFKSVNGFTSGLDFEFEALVQPGVFVDWYQEVAQFGTSLGFLTRENGEPLTNGNSIAYHNGKKLAKFGTNGSALAAYLRDENRDLAEHLQELIHAHLKELQNVPSR